MAFQEPKSGFAAAGRNLLEQIGDVHPNSSPFAATTTNDAPSPSAANGTESAGAPAGETGGDAANTPTQSDPPELASYREQTLARQRQRNGEAPVVAANAPTDATAPSTALEADDDALPADAAPKTRERFNKLLADRKALADEVAALKAGTVAAPPATEVAPAPVELPAIDYSQMVMAPQVEKATAELDQFTQNIRNGRALKIAEWEAQVEANQITLAEFKAYVADGDARANRDLELGQKNLEILKLRAAQSERVIADRSNLVKAALAPVLGKYPYANAALVESYVNQGYDPESTAKWSHEMNAPIVDSVLASKIADAKTEAVAPLTAELESLRAEVARLKKVSNNNAAAIATIGSRGAGGGVAPAHGVELPLNNRLGFAQKARQLIGLT